MRGGLCALVRHPAFTVSGFLPPRQRTPETSVTVGWLNLNEGIQTEQKWKIAQKYIHCIYDPSMLALFLNAVGLRALGKPMYSRVHRRKTIG